MYNLADLESSSTMFNRILIVCVGNICRSPTAEILLQEMFLGSACQISSAGLSALVGKEMEPIARAILQAKGHAPHAHQARQLTRELLHCVDLVLAMEKKHINHILEIAPEARGKVFLLGKWQKEREIDDPYRRGEAAFQLAYEQILEGTRAWATHIKP